MFYVFTFDPKNIKDNLSQYINKMLEWFTEEFMIVSSGKFHFIGLLKDAATIVLNFVVRD